MIKSVLIANRGEIAIRIIKTAKRLGIKTYVLLTKKEPNSLYVQEADEICDITETTSAIPEFLDIENILSVAVKNKIEAIHPGYGFLAESPYFAQRCKSEGITFIGPSPEVIYNMGNKTIARQIAIKHKIPLLQGSKQNVKSVKEALALAENIGYPVIIKAAAGGGGKGMRIVREKSQMSKMYNLARSESEKAFNDSAVFIERYIDNPKHIEFQILADSHGNCIHLGERECSIQRKHQKLLEEAPSVALNDELREKMGRCAIELAKAVGYENAGTVEFLLDGDNNYYFMEMNTRIQVEHPVTELVTGIDLVEQQFKIANGEKLNYNQENIKLKGAAIEFRVNAEDVQTNFSPNIGIVENIVMPKGENVRVDSGFTDKAVISPDFDSMIAKIIVYGKTREEAIKNSIEALNQVRIKGIKSTVPFFKAVLRNKHFINGDFTTAFLDKQMKKMYHQEADEDMIAAFLIYKTHMEEIEIMNSKDLDFGKGRELPPWQLTNRIKSL